MKPLKEAVSLVITNTDGEFIAVKRPDNPSDDIAGVWGLPAVTLKENETHAMAAQRIGRQKLGIEIWLGERIGESTHDRNTYTLHLTDYKATIKAGEPVVPQSDATVTQYSECKFVSDPILLKEAARKGSQCTQIYLESLGIDWADDKTAK